MRKQRARVFLFVVSVFALTLQGCAVKRWLSGPSSTSSATPEPVTGSPPSLSSASAPPGDSPAPLDWDFAQRADREKTAERSQVPPQTAKVTPPAPPPPVAPARAGSSGPRNWIPGLSDGKKESEDNPQYVTEADLLKVVTEFQRLAGKDTYRFP